MGGALGDGDERGVVKRQSKSGQRVVKDHVTYSRSLARVKPAPHPPVSVAGRGKCRGGGDSSVA